MGEIYVEERREKVTLSAIFLLISNKLSSSPALRKQHKHKDLVIHESSMASVKTGNL